MFTQICIVPTRIDQFKPADILHKPIQKISVSVSGSAIGMIDKYHIDTIGRSSYYGSTFPWLLEV